MSSSSEKSKSTFPVGPAGRRELRRALLTATDPSETIQSFRRSHSLHSMLSRAFHTVPRHAANDGQEVESMDTDSVVLFLSHLGVSQHEVHRRIADAMRTQLEDEIRRVQGTEPLLHLLKSCWTYSTSIPELRPVLWAVLKQLGSDTPQPVLELLGERDKKTGEMKHVEVWHPLPPLVKRLVWETDWDRQVGQKEPDDPQEYYELLKTTLFVARIEPMVDEYCSQPVLVEAANRPFVASLRDRRVATSQRRTRSSSKPGAAHADAADLAEPVSQIRKLLAAGEHPVYRPKLLNAILTFLMARHGKIKDQSLLGGATHLQCTLVADILLSGPLPKAYQHVLTLARTLDEAVKTGVITDSHVAQIQESLRHIYPSEEAGAEPATPNREAPTSQRSTYAQGFVKDVLKKIITTALDAMKEADPRSLFLNPVTDAIAPGYSKVIAKPMSFKQMEAKLGEYRSLQEWERDVQLMFRNCIEYNVGNEGQWFRGEARRQGKIFREEVFPQARRQYQTAMVKRGDTGEDRPKRKLDVSQKEPSVEVIPLPGNKFKKRKKEEHRIHPSMPAVASMLLSDPFVVRLLLDRELRCLRIDACRGGSIPSSHRIIPSLLQLLNIANWSTQICSVRGKRFFIPSVGFSPTEDSDDPSDLLPFASLRQFMPLLMKLFLEAELDRRVDAGGDLNPAVATLPDRSNLADSESWERTSHYSMHVMRALVEGALVHVCQPGNSQGSSLASTFPKFCLALQNLSPNLWYERPFFLSLIQAILRHKAKLPRNVRDTIVSQWIGWLRTKPSIDNTPGSITSSAHECFVMLLNEWAALGNLLLPRDMLLKFSKDAADACDCSEDSVDRKFASLWYRQGVVPDDFEGVKTQYERMLHLLSPAQATQWKQDLGLLTADGRQNIAMDSANTVQGSANKSF